MGKKLVLGGVLCGLVVALMATPAIAELKPVNRLMIVALRDMNALLYGIITYDFAAIAATADSFSARELRVSKIPRLSKGSKRRHGEIAEHVGHIATAAKAKDKDGIVKHYTETLMVCHDCHANVRDKPKK